MARTIDLDASKWLEVSEFYADLLQALGAPTWHGSSIAAVIDTVIWDNCNSIQPPFAIKVHSMNTLPINLFQHIELLRSRLIAARAEHSVRQGFDVDVTIETFD